MAFLFPAECPQNHLVHRVPGNDVVDRDVLVRVPLPEDTSVELVVKLEVVGEAVPANVVPRTLEV